MIEDGPVTNKTTADREVQRIITSLPIALGFASGFFAGKDSVVFALLLAFLGLGVDLYCWIRWS